MISEREDSNLILAEEMQSLDPSLEFPTGIYTSKYDLFNSKHPGVFYPFRPVQAKCIGEGNAIELGDIFRNSQKEEDFELLVSFYDRIDPVTKVPNVTEEIRVLVDHLKWNEQFHFDHYDAMRAWIRGVSNCYSYDAKWKKEREFWKKRWGKGRLVTPTFKRDHKKQKRIQSNVTQTNFKPFIKAVAKKHL